jgi:hypothetical protein
MLNDEDRRVYEIWLRNIILLYSFIVGTTAIIFMVLALNAVTPEQRALLTQQSGMYP